MNIQAAKERLGVALLLTLSGGFLDAFTFVGHGKVFANSMSGNVVLLGIELANGDRSAVSTHLWPLAGFAFALLAGHLLRLGTPRRPLAAAIGSLVLEILFLASAAAGLRLGLLLIPGIAFFATLQNTFFAQSGGLNYSNVMTTGNLRGAFQRLFESTIPRRDRAGLRQAGILGTISVSFAVGAATGGIITPYLHDRALCVPGGLLFLALLYMGWVAKTE